MFGGVEHERQSEMKNASDTLQNGAGFNDSSREIVKSLQLFIHGDHTNELGETVDAEDAASFSARQPESVKCSVLAVLWRQPLFSIVACRWTCRTGYTRPTVFRRGLNSASPPAVPGFLASRRFNGEDGVKRRSKRHPSGDTSAPLNHLHPITFR